MEEKTVEDQINDAIDSLNKETKSKEAEEQNTAKELSKEEKLQAEVDELTSLLQRTRAEFDNFQKREERERKLLLEYACTGFVKSLLPVVDSFEMAMKSEKIDENFKKGVEMVYAQLKDVFTQNNIVKIEALGKKADPYKHDILMKGASDKEEDTIIEEFQAGYMYKDRVVRHAKVKVADAK